MARNVRQKNFGSGDPLLDFAAGMVPGIRSANIFGRNPDVDAGVQESVWNIGGLWAGPTSAQKIQLVSTSAQDDAVTGNGAQVVTVVGLTSWSSDSTVEI